MLLILPEVFNCSGGIQMFGRALCLAAGRWAKESGASASALVLNDREIPDERPAGFGFTRFAGFGKNKSKLIAAFTRQLVSDRPDWLIFGHVSLAPLALLAKTIRPGTKTCIITYGIEVWQPLTSTQSLALKKADLVLAISEFTKEQLIKHNALAPDKIKRFPCTLDPHWKITTPLSTNGHKALIMLSVTRMNKDDDYKGIDSVIRSLPEVVGKVGPVEYRVVGEGDDVPRLLELATNLGVDRYVNFMGALVEAELQEQYRHCSLFVMPSSREGFGIVFLEAMAYGKAVVGGAHGGTPSVVKDGETGLLVDKDDVDALARSITRLLSDPELRERFGSAGYQRLLDNFTFDKFETNFRALLGLG